MVMRVQKICDDYGVLFSAQALEALHLSEGAEVEVRLVKTEPLHSETYRELAK